MTGNDTHIILVPSPGGPVPTPMTLPFAGTITGACSPNVKIDGMPAAVVGSTATNMPAHIPPGGSFQTPPTNQGTVAMGSATVYINGKAAARAGDPVNTCNDPSPAPTSKIQGMGTVSIGG